MYERMLDKGKAPCEADLRAYIGEAGCTRLAELERILSQQYALKRDLRFPFGNSYGWGYKYSHKSAHLCYAFFEKGAFTIMVQIGDQRVSWLEKNIDLFSPKARALWKNRYPCGEHGGWVRIRVLEDTDLQDAVQFIRGKKAPSNIKIAFKQTLN